MSASRPYNEPNLARDQRLERTLESLESSGSVVCIPWTGRDISGTRYCPGFEWHPNLGLMCYVMPLILVETIPELKRDMIFSAADPVEKNPDSLPTPRPGQDVSTMEMAARIIDTYLRRLRIILPPQIQVNLAANIMENNSKYYVLAQGNYPDSLYGLVIERPDPTGEAYLSTGGVQVDPYDETDNRPHINKESTPGPGIDYYSNLTPGQRMRAKFESVGLIPIRGGCRARRGGYSWFNVTLPAVRNAQAVWRQYQEDEEEA